MVLQNTKVTYSESKTDLIDGAIETLNVSDLARDTFAERPANFMIILNNANKQIEAHLDGVVYPIPANNGILSIKRDDLIRFNNVELINNSGANSTGTLNIVYGWLYQDIIGSLDVLDPRLR